MDPTNFKEKASLALTEWNSRMEAHLEKSKEPKTSIYINSNQILFLNSKEAKEQKVTKYQATLEKLVEVTAQLIREGADQKEINRSLAILKPVIQKKVKSSQQKTLIESLAKAVFMPEDKLGIITLKMKAFAYEEFGKIEHLKRSSGGANGVYYDIALNSTLLVKVHDASYSVVLADRFFSKLQVSVAECSLVTLTSPFGGEIKSKVDEAVKEMFRNQFKEKALKETKLKNEESFSDTFQNTEKISSKAELNKKEKSEKTKEKEIIPFAQDKNVNSNEEKNDPLIEKKVDIEFRNFHNITSKNYLMLMHKVDGVPFIQLEKSAAVNLLKNEGFLRDLGHVVIFDHFIGNGDRLDKGKSNLGNIIYNNEGYENSPFSIGLIDHNYRLNTNNIKQTLANLKEFFNSEEELKGIITGLVDSFEVSEHFNNEDRGKMFFHFCQGIKHGSNQIMETFSNPHSIYELLVTPTSDESDNYKIEYFIDMLTLLKKEMNKSPYLKKISID